MAKFNLDYYSGENFYSDGDIEKEILKIVKTQGSYESMENVPFPVLYHLSRVRENILNWYPFQEDATCLEIGSGCGAISGLLCERMKKVVSVELSKQRADINMARHERVPNLEIWVGNLNDMVFGEQFDTSCSTACLSMHRALPRGISRARRFLRISNGCSSRRGSC